MMKKRYLVLILIIVLMITIPSYATEVSQSLPTSAQDAIKQANDFIGFQYFKTSNKNNLLLNESLSTGVWGKYKDKIPGGIYQGNNDIDFGYALVYGSATELKNGVPRYLGETVGGDKFENIYYPMDSWAGGYIEDRNWVESPWYNSLTKDKFVDNTFDAFRSEIGDKYHDNIINGIEQFYSKILNGSYKEKAWENYVHVIQPPTYHTFGVGIMWHQDKNGKPWSLTVPIAPFSKLEDEAKVITIGNDTADGCFLGDPQKVGSSMETYVIRGPRYKITEPIHVPIRIYLLENISESISFIDDKIPKNIGWGKLIFDEVVEITPDKPYWVKKITYPVPLVGHKSGILVQTGNDNIKNGRAVTNYCQNVKDFGLTYGSHTTSEFELLDFLPWDRIEKEYGIKRLTEEGR